MNGTHGVIHALKDIDYEPELSFKVEWIIVIMSSVVVLFAIASCMSG